MLASGSAGAASSPHDAFRRLCLEDSAASTWLDQSALSVDVGADPGSGNEAEKEVLLQLQEDCPRSHEQGIVFCRFFCLHSLLLLCCAVVWLTGFRRADMAECLSGLQGKEGSLLFEYHQLRDEHARLQKELGASRASRPEELAIGPFEWMAGSHGHRQPEMYGKVRERTIWAFWHDEQGCPSVEDCRLPPEVALCVETVVKNRGSFDYNLLRMDEVEKYVDLSELPVRWRDMPKEPQREALMNALLARYGGVSLDVTTILFQPLDDHWYEMVDSGATLRGYAFRLNGDHWSRPEVLSTWFLMSRREGLMRSAARNQIVWMGDTVDALGPRLTDKVLLPVLDGLNMSLPKCSHDPTVGASNFSGASRCPEVAWGGSGKRGAEDPKRNDMKVLLLDPRDGPLLPFAFEDGMLLWDVEDTEDRSAGNAHFDLPCRSSRECWQDVFRGRLHQQPASGTAPLLPLVPTFGLEGSLSGLTRTEILAKKSSFFTQWLSIAGIDVP